MREKRGEEKKDGNTEITEVRTQSSQREAKRKRKDNAEAQRTRRKREADPSLRSG